VHEFVPQWLGFDRAVSLAIATGVLLLFAVLLLRASKKG